MSKPGNFIEKLFDSKFSIRGLNNYQHPSFDCEVSQTREEAFISLNNERWHTGKEFLENFKIVLA